MRNKSAQPHASHGVLGAVHRPRYCMFRCCSETLAQFATGANEEALIHAMLDFAKFRAVYACFSALATRTPVDNAFVA
jgi:hypothetical protein